ncbi:hypothetical protein [Streptosporangium sp. NPDC001681]|uniref:hypothetical protein n=1 Tax=Streptosporangium sp. NPDC001681 TaxID=3154395 RepID=UPI003319A8F3
MELAETHSFPCGESQVSPDSLDDDRFQGLSGSSCRKAVIVLFLAIIDLPAAMA